MGLEQAPQMARHPTSCERVQRWTGYGGAVLTAVYLALAGVALGDGSGGFEIPHEVCGGLLAATVVLLGLAGLIWVVDQAVQRLRRELSQDLEALVRPELERLMREDLTVHLVRADPLAVRNLAAEMHQLLEQAKADMHELVTRSISAGMVIGVRQLPDSGYQPAVGTAQVRDLFGGNGRAGG